jgi:hypothetical protein
MANKDRLTPVLFAWNDLLLSLLACLLVAAFLIAAQKKPTPTELTDRSAGSVAVIIFWPDGDIDVDTWMQSPDGDVVSFQRKSGTVWSLLRDDLGNPNDLTPHNFENSFARGLPPGEYVVNSHLYRNPSGGPVQIQGELRIKSGPTGSGTVFNASATLDHIGEEVTLWRFQIDASGNLVPGSVHAQFLPLARPEK